ncbi:MAG: hypothetical protein ACOC2U_02665 [bacterium]
MEDLIVKCVALAIKGEYVKVFCTRINLSYDNLKNKEHLTILKKNISKKVGEEYNVFVYDEFDKEADILFLNIDWEEETVVEKL